MSKNGYWFYSAVSRRILDAMDRGDNRIDISVDLNLSRGTFALCGEGLTLDAENRLSREELRRIEGKENRIFHLEDGRLEVLEAVVAEDFRRRYPAGPCRYR